MKKPPATQAKLKQLLPLLEDTNDLLIVLQDYPDPDAIGSAAALRALANHTSAVHCFIACGGAVGRAENQAMVRYLDLHLHRVDELDLSRFDTVAMMDTQPGTGNNSLPASIMPDIVIDHHPVKRLTRSAPFTDIRSRYGATSTILYEYLVGASVDLDASLATALLYGIRSDTHDLGRETTQADIDAYLALYPLANKRALGKIETGRVPRTYFAMLARALANAQAYPNCVVSDLGVIDNPDMIAETADLLLRDEETEWAMSFGFYSGKALFSLRTTTRDDAGKIARRIAGRKGSGGGHAALAAGQIPLKSDTVAERKRVTKLMVSRFLRALRIKDPKPQKLIPPE